MVEFYLFAWLFLMMRLSLGKNVDNSLKFICTCLAFYFLAGISFDFIKKVPSVLKHQNKYNSLSPVLRKNKKDIVAILLTWSYDPSALLDVDVFNKSIQQVWVPPQNVKILTYDNTKSEEFVQELNKILFQYRENSWLEDQLVVGYSWHWSMSEKWVSELQLVYDWDRFGSNDLNWLLEWIVWRKTILISSCAGATFHALANKETIVATWGVNGTWSQTTYITTSIMYATGLILQKDPEINLNRFWEELQKKTTTNYPGFDNPKISWWEPGGKLILTPDPY